MSVRIVLQYGPPAKILFRVQGAIRGLGFRVRSLIPLSNPEMAQVVLRIIRPWSLVC